MAGDADADHRRVGRGRRAAQPLPATDGERVSGADAGGTASGIGEKLFNPPAPERPATITYAEGGQPVYR